MDILNTLSLKSNRQIKINFNGGDISLREKEKEIRKDLDDGIDTIGKKYHDEGVILLGTGLRISELCGLTETERSTTRATRKSYPK